MVEQTDLNALEKRLGYKFSDSSLLVRALTHKSFSHEVEQSGGHNETLEFLGDSVLGFVVGSALFRQFGTVDEGTLSKMKAHLVSSRFLAIKARSLGLGEYFRLGVGEERTGGRTKHSLLANLYEAVIAAIFLDGGIESASSFIHSCFDEDIAELDERDLTFRDFKTALQEVAQSRRWALPVYKVVDQLGPDHAREFVVSVSVDGRKWEGRGSSKKAAQQGAARVALQELSLES